MSLFSKKRVPISPRAKFKRALDAAINEARSGALQDWLLLHDIISDLEQMTSTLKMFISVNKPML